MKHWPEADRCLMKQRDTHTEGETSAKLRRVMKVQTERKASSIDCAGRTCVKSCANLSRRRTGSIRRKADSSVSGAAAVAAEAGGRSGGGGGGEQTGICRWPQRP